jgi:DNA-binding NarL/FixJ family response regulator
VTSRADAVAPGTGIDLAAAAAAAPQEVLKRLGSSDSGLSGTEAAGRLERYGPNVVGQVVAQLLGASRRNDGLGALTGRERDVLALMAEGRSNAAIAGILVVSERSVEKHVGNIFSKLGLAPSDADHRRVLAVLRYLQS